MTAPVTQKARTEESWTVQLHHAIRLSAGPLAKAIQRGCSATRIASNATRGDPLQRMVVG